MRVCIINGNAQYSKMFKDRGWDITPLLEEADLVQFTGGADVTPSIYGEENTASHNDYHRDLQEAGIFAIALRMGKPMAGICRGGQFLNVMCGGKMIQHIPNHAIHGTHALVKSNVQVTSTHHQGIVAGDDGLVIDWAEDKIEEVVFYLEQKALCFQPHPEFDGYKECQDYYFNLLGSYLGVAS